MICNGSFRAGGHSGGVISPVVTNGILNIFDATANRVFVNNYCSGSGLKTTVRADNGGVSYTYKGVTYTGAIINVAFGGELGGTYNLKRSGSAPSSTENYGFSGAEGTTFGDIVNIAENVSFGDFYGGSRGTAGWTSSTADTAGLHGNVTSILTDCTMREFCGGVGKAPVYGSITNTVTRCRMEHFYGGGGNYDYNSSDARVFGDITNTLTDCEVQGIAREGEFAFWCGSMAEGGYYGGGRGDQVGTPEDPVTLTNILRTERNDNIIIRNFYGGISNNSRDGEKMTATIYGDIVNELTNIDTYGNICSAGCFVGCVDGDISTVIDGANTRIGTFLASGLRVMPGSVTGDVSVVIRGGTYRPGKAISPGSSAYTYTYSGVDYVCTGDPGAASYSVVFDLTDNDINALYASSKFSELPNVSVEIIAGAGKLYIDAAYSKLLPVTTLTGKPTIEIVNGVKGGQGYLQVPEGKTRSDVTITWPESETIVYKADDRTFYGLAATPVGNTLILQEDGNFAMRYLFAPDDIAAWEAETAQTATFELSRDGGATYTAVTLSDITIDGVDYKTFVVEGISAKNIGLSLIVRTNTTSVEDSYSIAKAAAAVISANENEDFVAFAKALLDYGKAAYEYFYPAGYEGAKPASPSSSYNKEIDETWSFIYPDDFSDDGAAGDVQIVGTSVSACDALYLNFYMKILNDSIDPATLKLAIDGTETDAPLTEKVMNGVTYYVAWYRVPVTEMDLPVEATIVDENGDVISNTYTDSVASYCTSVILNAENEGYEAAHVLLCKYIEEFIQASVNYFTTI